MLRLETCDACINKHIKDLNFNDTEASVSCMEQLMQSSHLAKRETAGKAEHNQDWWSWNGEWGRKKRSIPDSWEMHGLTNLNVPIVEKRAWQRLQDMAAGFDPDDQTSMQNEMGYDLHEDDKRNWRKFNDGWGKRNRSWGKRDPAWSNLKGIWGKRSSQN
nr:unnamed protein product [Callosobruchus chinensis]